MTLNQQEITRYSKHINLLEINAEGQERIRNGKVLIIGAGGLGCPNAQLLGSTGVGTIGIVDGDIVDQSNLQRQFMYHPEDVGKPKAAVLAQRIAQQNPHIKVTPYIQYLNEENIMELLQPYDVILDCTDQMPIKDLLGSVSEKLNKVLVYGSLYKFEGQVCVFNYKNGPSYRQLFPPSNKKDFAFSCNDVGVYAILPGLIGSIQANETVKVLLNRNDVLSGRLLFFNSLTNQTTIINHTSKP